MHSLTIAGCLEDETELQITLLPQKTAVTACGDQAALLELCEQLAWLGAALRPSPISHGVSVATPQVQVWKDDTGDGDKPKVLAHIGFSMSPVVHHDTSAQLNGACWHSIFLNPVIVEGFPIPTRHEEQQGLEIPMELMIALAETDYATHYDETFLLKGTCTMLVPTKIKQTIIWHFLSNSDGESMPYHAFKERCPSWTAINKTSHSWSSISEMRNFVGWASQITRHLGMFPSFLAENQEEMTNS